jgi:hypothetical protein
MIIIAYLKFGAFSQLMSQENEKFKELLTYAVLAVFLICFKQPDWSC